jgi:hypothetical protein
MLLVKPVRAIANTARLLVLHWCEGSIHNMRGHISGLLRRSCGMVQARDRGGVVIPVHRVRASRRDASPSPSQGSLRASACLLRDIDGSSARSRGTDVADPQVTLLCRSRGGCVGALEAVLHVTVDTRFELFSAHVVVDRAVIKREPHGPARCPDGVSRRAFRCGALHFPAQPEARDQMFYQHR